MDWNHTVLSIAGSKIDFAIVHAYPTSTSPADLLTKPQAQNASITPRLRLPGDNGITNSWNASVSQSGRSVNAGNVSYNAAVPQGGSVQWGFKATWSSSDANPSAFRFNGASCAIG
ncbi:cellulose binding domain-containing protein [Kitasatospora sp. NPDC097643]|uniref:cellulose binding domain-containing protein n=1 Tax=Kitasatospora sp. NPDC097643 TaxID=3157230 RepID=UPI003332FC68